MNKFLDMLLALIIELDLWVFVVSVLSTGYVNSQRVNQTIRRFYPQDATLWREFSGNTISSGIVFLILYFLCAPLIYFVETYFQKKKTTKRSVSRRWQKRCAVRMAMGMFPCTMLAVLVAELGKGYVGRLRPSYARTCLSAINPPYLDSADILTRTFASDADCISSNVEALEDLRRSFPSGHASLSMAGCAYTQLMLIRSASHAQIPHATATGIYLGSWLVSIFASWVCASRIYDNAHHPSDVVSGAVIGLWSACVHFYFVVSTLPEESDDVDVGGESNSNNRSSASVEKAA